MPHANILELMCGTISLLMAFLLEEHSTKGSHPDLLKIVISVKKIVSNYR